MNNDLISRSELKSVLKNECFWCANRDEPCDKSCWRCINEKVDNAPTVEYPFYQEAYQTGYEEGNNERPQGDIRWTDKLSVKSNGDIIDFEGRVVGHINLEEIKGGAEE